MADVHFVSMRDAAARADKLASLFEAAGRTIGGPPETDSETLGAGVVVIVWSQASRGSAPFMAACERVVSQRPVIVVRACAFALPDVLAFSPSFDLSYWRGDLEDPALKPFLGAVEDIAPGAEDDLVAQVRAWRAIDPLNEDDLKSYVRRFGADGYFSDLARHRLSRLEARPRAEKPPSARKPARARRDWTFLRPLGLITAVGGAAAAAAIYFLGNEVASPAFATPTVEMHAYAPLSLEPAPVEFLPAAFQPEVVAPPVVAAPLATFKVTPVAAAHGGPLEALPAPTQSDLASLDDVVVSAAPFRR